MQCQVVEKISLEAQTQSAAFDNLGVMASLPNLSHADMQTSSQATARVCGTQNRCLMHVSYPELSLGHL